MFKLAPYLRLLRPRQWIKNFFVAAPLLFGAKLLDPLALIQCGSAFLVFCLAASLIYIFNDWRDIKVDRQHPKNKARPLASGAVSPKGALVLALLLIYLMINLSALSFAKGYLSGSFFALVLLYASINLGYSLGLKHIALFEMFLVASGYVLRVIAGCVAISVSPSPWIIVVSGVVSMLIVAGKRRAEMVDSSPEQVGHKVVAVYNLAFLDSMIAIFGSASIITYMLFTLSEKTIQIHHTENLIYTSIFVVFGITRYILLIQVRGGAEAPTDLVIADKGLCLTVLLWVASLVFIMYR